MSRTWVTCQQDFPVCGCMHTWDTGKLKCTGLKRVQENLEQFAAE
jgi:hypothetical protein